MACGVMQRIWYFPADMDSNLLSAVYSLAESNPEVATKYYEERSPPQLRTDHHLNWVYQMCQAYGNLKLGMANPPRLNPHAKWPLPGEDN